MMVRFGAVGVVALALVGAACGGTAGSAPDRNAGAAAAVTTIERSVSPEPEAVPAATSPVTTTEPSTITEPSTTTVPTTAASVAGRPDDGAPAVATVPSSTTAAARVRSGAVVSPAPSVGDPLAISIPAIGVTSVLTPTGYLPDGTVDVPDDPSLAGWFEPGPRPGERGPAVVMGHVDSRAEGPGVFYRLRDIAVGDVTTIETETGPIRFVVQSVEQHPKDRFPTERVYGPVHGAALRLITCGGSFDRSARSYRDNIVVFLVPERSS